MTLPYDLADAPVPVLASSSAPALAGESTETFSVRKKQVMYLHGLFGHKRPDIADIVAEQSKGCSRIENFRVRRGTAVQDWFATHLSLSLVRIKTVHVEGTRVLTEPATRQPD